MKRHGGIVLFVILAVQLLWVPLQASPARADTRVTITIAAGGAACGAYLFLRLVFRSLATGGQDPLDPAALLDHGPEGWRIQFPTMDLRGSRPDISGIPVNSDETLQMGILKVRF